MNGYEGVCTFKSNKALLDMFSRRVKEDNNGRKIILLRERYESNIYIYIYFCIRGKRED